MSEPKKNCRACRFSYMEPDSGLICGLPELGTFGRTIRKDGEHCAGFSKFEQHRLRNRDGSLKVSR
jgi:hypothetical protein